MQKKTCAESFCQDWKYALSPINTKSLKEVCAWSCLHIATVHSYLNRIRNFWETLQSDLSHITQNMEQGQGHRNWYEEVKLNGSYHHAKLERSCLHTSWEHSFPTSTTTNKLLSHTWIICEICCEKMSKSWMSDGIPAPSSFWANEANL